MRVVNLPEFMELVHERRGAQPVTLCTETVPSMNKTDNPFYDKIKKCFRVKKRSWVNGMIGWSYQNSVNNQREREGHTETFAAQPRKWGERIPGSPLVRNKELYYLELKVERSVEAPLYYLDGELVENEERLDEIKSYLVKKKQALTQETDKEIILRDYALTSLLSIKLGGEEYRVSIQ